MLLLVLVKERGQRYGLDGYATSRSYLRAFLALAARCSGFRSVPSSIQFVPEDDLLERPPPKNSSGRRGRWNISARINWRPPQAPADREGILCDRMRIHDIEGTSISICTS